MATVFSQGEWPASLGKIASALSGQDFRPEAVALVRKGTPIPPGFLIEEGIFDAISSAPFDDARWVMVGLIKRIL